jgi:hypothetical protein
VTMIDPTIQPCGILKNTATGRFHPIVFQYNPPPSGDLGEGVGRYKSRGHCTKGKDTLEEAISLIERQPTWEWTGFIWEWDGIEVPAMVQWFGVTRKQDGQPGTSPQEQAPEPSTPA